MGSSANTGVVPYIDEAFEVVVAKTDIKLVSGQAASRQRAPRRWKPLPSRSKAEVLPVGIAFDHPGDPALPRTGGPTGTSGTGWRGTLGPDGARSGVTRCQRDKEAMADRRGT